jgi:hypothetical protein
MFAQRAARGCGGACGRRKVGFGGAKAANRARAKPHCVAKMGVEPGRLGLEIRVWAQKRRLECPADEQGKEQGKGPDQGYPENPTFLRVAYSTPGVLGLPNRLRSGLHEEAWFVQAFDRADLSSLLCIPDDRRICSEEGEALRVCKRGD